MAYFTNESSVDRRRHRRHGRRRHPCEMLFAFKLRMNGQLNK